MSAAETRDALNRCAHGAHVWRTPPPPSAARPWPATTWQTCQACGAARCVATERAYGALVPK